MGNLESAKKALKRTASVAHRHTISTHNGGPMEALLDRYRYLISRKTECLMRGGSHQEVFQFDVEIDQLTQEICSRENQPMMRSYPMDYADTVDYFNPSFRKEPPTGQYASF